MKNDGIFIGICVCVVFFIFISVAQAQDNPLRSTVVVFNQPKNLLKIDNPASPPSLVPNRSNFFPLSERSGPSRSSFPYVWPERTNPFNATLTVDTNESKQLAAIISEAKKPSNHNKLITGSISVGKTFIVVLAIYDNTTNAVTLLYSDKNATDVSNALSRALVNLPATAYAIQQLTPSFIATPIAKNLKMLSPQVERLALQVMVTSQGRKFIAPVAKLLGKKIGESSFKTLISAPFIIVTSAINFVQQCVDFANEFHAMGKRMDELKPLQKECISANLDKERDRLMNIMRIQLDNNESITDIDRELRKLDAVKKTVTI